LESIRAVPGVEAASSIHFLPLEERTSGSCFWPEGTKPNPADAPGAEFLIVSPDYFRTMNIAILRGRDFSPGDRFGGPTAMIVNRAFVDHFYPGENLIGRRFSVCWTPPNPAEVVGIVGDARQSDLESSPKPTIFLDNLQAPMYFATFVVRTRVEPKPMARAIEAAIHQVDPDQPVSDVQTMSEVFSDSVAQPRFQLLLLSVFAAIAVALAMIGVYGVLAYAVTQQRQEIGVRVALGAQARDVMRLIVREGLLLAVAGTSIGLVAAFALTRAVRSLLFEVTPTDPATLALASVLLLIVALAASVLPARRAVRLDPVAALRWE
jgi:putative ABC transport system permease protein